MNQPIRSTIVERLRGDLVGPVADYEVLLDRPSERYVTGMLFPQGETLPPDEDDKLPDGGAEEESGSAPASESVSLSHTMRPSSIALSFAATHDGLPELEVEIRGGRYAPLWTEAPQTAVNAKWQRTPVLLPFRRLAFEGPDVSRDDLVDDHLVGLSLRTRWVKTGPTTSIFTVALVNDALVTRDRLENQKSAFFQAELRVRARGGTALVERPSRRTGEEEELRLLYRHVHEYAVGHGCSADWSLDESGVAEVRTSWLPSERVASVSAEGQPACKPLKGTTFSAAWLAQANVDDLRTELGRLPDLYESWICQQHLEPGAEAYQEQATKHLDACRDAARRMRGAIELLTNIERLEQPTALRAFQLAMAAMNKQRQWAKHEDLYWRPFQLGFQLLALESLSTTNHPDRELMDLLWFPTGGGKTEAYFGLIAFLLFHRRLRNSGSPDLGAGTAVLMRYTLRLLTIQQFQRATRLITACEWLRCRENKPGELGQVPFSIGLWVGGGATPNSIAEAKTTIRRDENPTARQVTSCPACGEELHWSVKSRHTGKEHAWAQCRNAKCDVRVCDEGYLQVWTVDDDIYAVRPSLLIGTVDKFTQIVRKPSQTTKLFGKAGTEPPDLILQDELHLISGPLGSLAGLYEMAIDELCTRRTDGVVSHRPKVIGSTATIRAADAQVRSLFARSARQFPPPELVAEDGFFARRTAESEHPGRLYVGMTSAGRSPKYALQALYASLLQSGRAVATSDPKERDPWWTLVGYFNSLRELGGALVMLSDDVPVSIGVFARARGEEGEMRAPHRVDELTSRKSQIELRDTLSDIERLSHPDEAAFDAILATNMISVGVDVDRLGLMAVTHQPKQMAEYIQATSRVGRQHPGLVVVLYNNSRARDRSYFETFRSWHQALYRDVEATSVTPLAPRARDKALHAVIIALATSQVHGLATSPKLTPERRKEIEDGIVSRLVARADIVDSAEVAGFQADVKRVLDRWSKRMERWIKDGVVPEYWMDSNPGRTLMMSAESEAAHRAAGNTLGDVFPTLNSLRNVEASSPFKLLEMIRIDEENVNDD